MALPSIGSCSTLLLSSLLKYFDGALRGARGTLCILKAELYSSLVKVKELTGHLLLTNYDEKSREPDL